MNGLGALVRTEAVLFLRNPTSVFMATVLPAALLMLQAFVIPGTMNPIPGVGEGDSSLRMIDLFVPIAVVIALTSVSITNYPSTIGSYRESGVLRRLDVTPVGARRILLAQWIISAASMCASVILTALLAGLAFAASAPRNIPAAVAVICFGAVALMALGSLIASRAPNAQTAYGLGLFVFMGSLFAAGVWTPGPLMDETLKQAVSFTPSGALTQALTSAWYEGTVEIQPFLVMFAWALLCGFISLRMFRWR